MKGAGGGVGGGVAVDGGEGGEPDQVSHEELQVHGLPPAQLVGSLSTRGGEAESHRRLPVDGHVARRLQRQQRHQQLVGRWPLALGGETVLQVEAAETGLGDVEQSQQHLGPQLRPHAAHRNVLLRYREGVVCHPGQTIDCSSL